MFKRLVLLYLIQVNHLIESRGNDEFSNKIFPKEFKFGVGSAAYQIEGAWNVDGRGECIWDRLTHTQQNYHNNVTNADMACDFYHKFSKDIQILKQLGVDHFRLSVSWPRILPYGTNEFINTKGIAYYRLVFKELLKNGIEPMVTMYHWDLPQVLHERGGFLNMEFVDWFTDYGRILFDELGDLVKFWSTFNEPSSVCQYGYGMPNFAPGLNRSGVFDYICGHNLLKAHAKVYHLYDKQYRYKQNGTIGIVLQSSWYEPNTNKTEDIAAVENSLQFELGWFANPIYLGNYPEVMKTQVARRSRQVEGRKRSRLPEFTPDEIEYIKGTYDYFGINHYTTLIASAINEEESAEVVPNLGLDRNADLKYRNDWEATCADLFKVVPYGMRKLLAFIKDRYQNPTIYITENGVCDFGGLEDHLRIYFIKSYLSNVRDAIEIDKVDVKGYTYWNFMDDFEWESGYKSKFGLYHIDFNSINLTRTPKKSAMAYKKIIETHCLVKKCIE